MLVHLCQYVSKAYLYISKAVVIRQYSCMLYLYISTAVPVH